MSEAHPQARPPYWWLKALAIILPVVALLAGATAYTSIETRLVDEAGSSLALAAAEVADKADQFLYERYGDLQMLAGMVALPRTDRTAVAQHLQTVKRSDRPYLWMAVTDAQGRIVAATDPEGAGQEQGRDWQSARAFQSARDMKTMHLGDVEPFGAAGGIDTVTISTPIFRQDEEFAGIVTARIALPALEERITQTLSTFTAHWAGPRPVEYQLVTRSGAVVLDSDLQHKGNVNLRGLGLPSMERAATGSPGYVEERHARRDVLVVTGYAGTRGYREMAGLGWTVLVRADRADILAPLRSAATQVGIGGGAIVLPLWLALIWAAGRWRCERVNARQEATRARAAEETERRAHDELEVRVRERTAALDAANAALHSEVAERAEAEEALARERVELERRVAERTEALAEINRSLIAEVAERRRLEEDCARLAHDRLLLLESTSQGIYGIDPEGRCTFINAAGARMLGYSPNELTGRHMHDLMHHTRPDGSLYPEEACPIYRAFRTGEACHVEDEMFWRRDGTPLPVEYSSHRMIEQGQVRGAVVIFSDTTERKEAEAKLIERTRLAALGAEIGIIMTRRDPLPRMLAASARALTRHLDAALAQIWAKDDAGTALELQVTAANPRQPDEAPAGSPPQPATMEVETVDATSPQWAETCEALRKRNAAWAERVGCHLHWQPAVMDHRLVGVITLAVRRPLSESATFALATVSDQIALAILKQRAEAGAAEAQRMLEHQREELRSLAAQLITVQEEERRRVSRELHDDLNQRLAMLAVEVEALAQNIPPSPELLVHQLRALQKKVAEVSDEVRRLAYQLHPSILDHLGLAVALRSYAEDMSRRGEVRVAFTHGPLPPCIPQDIASCLYRVAQESLRNVVRHAQADRVAIKLATAGRDLTLSIKDNGKGFDPAERQEGRWGLGIVSMRERIRLVNGTLAVESRPGQGVRIVARVPLPEGCA